MKKLVVLGRGTAGSQATIHFLRWMPDCEIEWHYDPNIKTQAVGEGSTLTLPRNLYYTLEFVHTDLEKIYGTPKYGVYKSGWGTNPEPFIHPFVGTSISYHFNAVALQEYVYAKIHDKVKIVEHNTSSDKIDADYVFDCSGRPQSLDEFDVHDDICVNSVHVTQCYWDHPTFYYTLAIARPYGWVFGIPLTNRCSIGYMYNNSINSLAEIQEDVKAIFKEYNLTPSKDTNTFSFSSYSRQVNFSDRIAYSGNTSFFLEPLEATSIAFMDSIQRNAFDLWNKNIDVGQANNLYTKYMNQLKTIILLHYCNGSAYNTDFWQQAEKKAANWIHKAVENDPEFNSILRLLKNHKHTTRTSDLVNVLPEYGNWWAGSFKQNITGLGLDDILL
jgi:hypothetical protein